MRKGKAVTSSMMPGRAQLVASLSTTLFDTRRKSVIIGIGDKVKPVTVLHCAEFRV